MNVANLKEISSGIDRCKVTEIDQDFSLKTIDNNDGILPAAYTLDIKGAVMGYLNRA